MSSRGHFIGQVIDDLDAISSQVRARCALNQTDLNGVLENFFRDILNLVRGINLKNLNEHRSNEPGLDLGDIGAKIAFQITSRADAAKINDTLKKITSEQQAKFDHVFILVIGERRASYKLDDAAAKRVNFTADNVLDMTALGREIIGLDISTLQAVHRKIADEQARIRIELEVRLPGQGFTTTIGDFIEPIPDVVRSDATLLFEHSDVQGLFDDVGALREKLDEFISKLARLPRLTREFYGWLIDQSQVRGHRGTEAFQVNYDLVARKSRLADTDGELRLLTETGFVSFDEPDDAMRSPHWRIGFPVGRGDFGDAFMYFVKAEQIQAATLFSTMNFSAFGPPPLMPSTPTT